MKGFHLCFEIKTTKDNKMQEGKAKVVNLHDCKVDVDERMFLM